MNKWWIIGATLTLLAAAPQPQVGTFSVAAAGNKVVVLDTRTGAFCVQWVNSYPDGSYIDYCRKVLNANADSVWSRDD